MAGPSPGRATRRSRSDVRYQADAAVNAVPRAVEQTVDSGQLGDIMSVEHLESVEPNGAELEGSNPLTSRRAGSCEQEFVPIG